MKTEKRRHKLVKTNVSGFYKNKKNNVIINNNDEELANYKQKLKNSQRINALEEQIKDTNSKLDQILKLLLPKE